MFFLDGLFVVIYGVLLFFFIRVVFYNVVYSVSCVFFFFFLYLIVNLFFVVDFVVFFVFLINQSRLDRCYCL